MISFIIPSHNYGIYLESCIKSILSNNPNYVKELIIINDSSTDNTDQVIAKLNIKEKKIKYFKKNFKNLSKTMNFAIRKTSGNIICKVDPDDRIKKNFAEILCKKFLELKTDFLYSDFIVLNLSSKKKVIKSQKINPLLNKFQYPHGSGCLYKKKVWKKIKGFNEKNFYQDDYDFWLKINKNNFKINYLNKAFYIYHLHGSNMSKNFLKKNFTKIKIFFSNLFN